MSYHESPRSPLEVSNIKAQAQQTRREHLANIIPDRVKRPRTHIKEICIVVITLVNNIPEPSKRVREEEQNPRLNPDSPNRVLQLCSQRRMTGYVDLCPVIADNLVRVDEAQSEDRAAEHQDKYRNVCAVVDAAG